ncbi:hypothetical protein LZ318_28755 [Saccharopolyspora indica]|uniref:hypothetical protein n=1 Tax=Saccharopolyspora indica TaxID=1229659 RepID=UPI0022EAED69|nr:hypothetical protein [Saccharopolyspora indica]MDA3646325.1 hypothetical protein [Saccharopolyspora indica]
MGLFKNSAADLGAMAAEAHAAGRARFVARLIALSSTKDDAIDPWAERIEAIEAVGWRVEHFSVAANDKGIVEAYVLFARV